MFLCALNDRGLWGQTILAEAVKRGWGTQLFNEAVQVEPNEGYGFFRIHQHPTWRTQNDKRQAYALIGRGIKPIPDLPQIVLYEDKAAQSEWDALRRFMPRTIVARSQFDAIRAAEEIGLPIISKSAEGSASSEVRLLRTPVEVNIEISRAFTDGIHGRYAVQLGYVIFQEFLEQNPFDYRVCAIGRQRMMLRRLVRSEEQPFASGSGKCVPITELDSETEAVLAVSDAFFEAAKTSWCGIDLVRDARDGTWKVLECTLAWTQKAYAECSFFGTPRKGAEIWSVLLDEIEAGTFG